LKCAKEIVLKEYTSVSIGVLTLLVAAFAAYGVTNMNTEILAVKPDPVQLPDYSDELNSLTSQVRSIKSDLVVLGSLKSDIAQIQQKLVDLEKKEAVIQQVAQQQRSQMLTLDLDRTTYLPGATIRITGDGAEPQTTVNIQILDSDGFVLINKEVWADSLGNVMYQLKLSDAMLPGIYQVKMVSAAKTATAQIRIDKADESSNSILIDQYTFTVKTNKPSYHTGEIIEVSGSGKPNVPVTATLTSPSGKTYTTNSSTQNDGTFLIFFATSSTYEDGKWYVSASHVSKTIVVSIIIN
jgi:hypothetical protein